MDGGPALFTQTLQNAAPSFVAMRPLRGGSRDANTQKATTKKIQGRLAKKFKSGSTFAATIRDVHQSTLVANQIRI